MTAQTISPTTPGARNGVALARSAGTDLRDLAARCADACRAGRRLAALLAVPASGNTRGLVAVLADDHQGDLQLLEAAARPGDSYPSVAAALPAAQAFERAILEEEGIVPEGHPWPKPLRRHPELAPQSARPAGGAPAHDFFRVEGDGVHEVAVGPVHAGIIEPGHFRFQCHGEVVLHLEIRLGYQGRGVERLLLGAPPVRRLAVAESIAGDSAVGHALAHCMAAEALAGCEPPPRAHALRALALELERLANHTGDLGALCGDIGYLPGASWFGRLRGDFLNLLTDLSGNRFGRGLVVPGGVRFDLDELARGDFLRRLSGAERDFRETADLAFDCPSVVARFERAGVLARDAAEALGLVGPAARASGCDRDVRRDHRHGAYKSLEVRPVLADGGDVLARAAVRRGETERSLEMAWRLVDTLPAGELSTPVERFAPDAMVVALVEAWRGEVLHLVTTDGGGTPNGYKVVDPSVHNWPGLAFAVRENPISDFPLCNKSFNLSYAGHDL